MAMTRKAAREALATLITTAGGFTVVNAFLPLTLNGASKICNIYTRASELDVESANLKNDFYTFNIDALVLRTGVAADENDLDTLHGVIVAVCVDNPKTANWSHLKLDGETEPAFVQDSGKQYRLERHRVKVKLTS
jgi:hypothetical protein